MRADASNCNLKADWPKKMGEYGNLWAETYKNDEWALPSMKEVVMGIYIHHMVTVEWTFKDLKEKDLDIGLYRNSMKKAFNKLFLCLDMGEEDINKPLTYKILSNPNNP